MKDHVATHHTRPLSHILRLLAFTITLAAIAIIATLLTRLLVPPAPSPWHGLVMVKNLALPIAELAAYAALVRRLEGRRVSEVKFDRRDAGLFGFGLLLGAALIAGAVLVLWALGLAGFARGSGGAGLLGELLVPFTTAVVEEILFRAILFRLAEEWLGTAPAAFLSAGLFALAHLGNPGATPAATLCLGLDLGLLTAVAFAYGRSLWLPIGLHLGWNLALGYLFGTLNSGVLDPASLVRTRFAGPSWLTGGAFGLEGSAVTVALSLLAAAALTMRARRNDGWRERDRA